MDDSEREGEREEERSEQSVYTGITGCLIKGSIVIKKMHHCNYNALYCIMFKAVKIEKKV